MNIIMVSPGYCKMYHDNLATVYVNAPHSQLHPLESLLRHSSKYYSLGVHCERRSRRRRLQGSKPSAPRLLYTKLTPPPQIYIIRTLRPFPLLSNINCANNDVIDIKHHAPQIQGSQTGPALRSTSQAAARVPSRPGERQRGSLRGRFFERGALASPRIDPHPSPVVLQDFPSAHCQVGERQLICLPQFG